MKRHAKLFTSHGLDSQNCVVRAANSLATSVAFRTGQDLDIDFDSNSGFSLTFLI